MKYTTDTKFTTCWLTRKENLLQVIPRARARAHTCICVCAHKYSWGHSRCNLFRRQAIGVLDLQNCGKVCFFEAHKLDYGRARLSQTENWSINQISQKYFAVWGWKLCASCRVFLCPFKAYNLVACGAAAIWLLLVRCGIKIGTTTTIEDQSKLIGWNWHSGRALLEVDLLAISHNRLFGHRIVSFSWV